MLLLLHKGYNFDLRLVIILCRGADVKKVREIFCCPLAIVGYKRYLIGVITERKDGGSL